MATAVGEAVAESSSYSPTTVAVEESSTTRRPLPVLLGALAVFVIALILHLAWINTVPANLNPDEADTLTTYLLAKYTGYPTILSFNWNGAPALNAYLSAGAGS